MTPPSPSDDEPNRGEHATRTSFAGVLFEGATAGLVLGAVDLLATGPWRVPPAFWAVALGLPLGGGLVAGLLAGLAGRRAGVAAALALAGGLALGGASHVSKGLGGALPPLALVLLLALTALGLALAAGRAGRSASLAALAAVPLGSLLTTATDLGGLTLRLCAGLLLPLLVWWLARGGPRPARRALGLALAAAALAPLPVARLDPPARPAADPASTTVPPAATAPDVLLVVIDTLREDAVDWTPGNPTTPQLAALAADGLRFEQVVSSAPWTLPSMASLFTGLLPSQHRAVTREFALADEATTLAERFRDAGYATGAFTGGAFVGPGYGLAQGFEHFDAQAEYWFQPLRVHVPLAWRLVKNRYRPLLPVLRRVHEFGGLRSLLTRLEPWLGQQDAQRPLLLLAHTYQVHDYYLYHPEADDAVRARLGAPPASVGERLSLHPEELFELDDETLAWFEARYRERLRIVDGQVGRLLERVRAARGERELLVVLTSDHGEGFDAASARVHHGGRLHDDLLRVPLVLHSSDPSRFAAPRVVRDQVRQVDIAPTLIDLAHLTPLERTAGQSLVPALRGQAPFPAVAWAEEHLAGPRWLTLRSPPWKLIDGPEGRQSFDLGSDPGESAPQPFEAPDGLQTLWRSFDERYPARMRSTARIDAAVRHQLDHIGYGD